jgi:hypothetical protein
LLTFDSLRALRREPSAVAAAIRIANDLTADEIASSAVTRKHVHPAAVSDRARRPTADRNRQPVTRCATRAPRPDAPCSTIPSCAACADPSSSSSTARRGHDKAIAAVFDGVPVQRYTVHKQRNLLAHAPDRITADYNDMIYAAPCEQIETRRKGFIRKWCSSIVPSPTAWRKQAIVCSA